MYGFLAAATLYLIILSAGILFRVDGLRTALIHAEIRESVERYPFFSYRRVVASIEDKHLAYDALYADARFVTLTPCNNRAHACN